MAINYEGKTILVSANEFAESSQYQQSLKEFTSVTTLVDPRKAYAVSSLNNWVIDTRTSNYMTRNLNIFSTFQSQKAPSQVMVVDGSTHNIVGFGTIKATSSIAMSYVLKPH